MPARISKRVREAAAFALELAASNAPFQGTSDLQWAWVRDVEEFAIETTHFDDHTEVVWLMRRAWDLFLGTGRASILGAAALLRDGWSPGDPVEHEYCDLGCLTFDLFSSSI